MILLVLFLGLKLEMSAWFWVLYALVVLLKIDKYYSEQKR